MTREFRFLNKTQAEFYCNPKTELSKYTYTKAIIREMGRYRQLGDDYPFKADERLRKLEEKWNRTHPHRCMICRQYEPVTPTRGYCRRWQADDMSRFHTCSEWSEKTT